MSTSLTEGSLIPKPAFNLEIVPVREQSIFIERPTISTQLNLKRTGFQL
jgi:hypothetical protein